MRYVVDPYPGCFVLSRCRWLPDDAQNTLAFGGYYAARASKPNPFVRHWCPNAQLSSCVIILLCAVPGLRVVCINTNFYADNNFWLVANHSDYSGQVGTSCLKLCFFRFLLPVWHLRLRA